MVSIGGVGYVFFLFSRKERTKEKSILPAARSAYLVQAFFYGAIYGKVHCFLAMLVSPRASGAYAILVSGSRIL